MDGAGCILQVVGSRKVLTDVTSGILQKASVLALRADSMAVQLWKAVLWTLLWLRLPEGISLCQLQELLFPPSAMNAGVFRFIF